MQVLSTTEFKRLKPTSRIYAVAVLVCVMPLAIEVVFRPALWQSILVQGSAAVTLAIAGIFFWISRFQVVVAPDSIAYSSLFSGLRRVSIQEIQTAELRGEFFNPIARLEIRPYKSTRKKPIVVYLELFRRSDIKPLLDKLGVQQPPR